MTEHLTGVFLFAGDGQGAKIPQVSAILSTDIVFEVNALMTNLKDQRARPREHTGEQSQATDVYKIYIYKRRTV